MKVIERKILRKICGMRDKGNILEIAELRPDYLGFIFYRNSKRFVGDRFAVPEELPESIKRVGVFVNQPLQEILKLARCHQLDLLQLHGTESAEQCKELQLEGFPVIKAIAIGAKKDLEVLPYYRLSVDYFLFDSKGNDFGGNGVSFDWSFLIDIELEAPFFLSGGISSSNVSSLLALKGMNLLAVDINTGVETKPGLKDIGKIKQLFSILDSKIKPATG